MGLSFSRSAWRRFLVGFLLVVGLLAGRTAAAHPTPSSTAVLSFGGAGAADGAHLEQDVPLFELEMALGRPLCRAADCEVATFAARESAALEWYVRSHLALRAEGSNTDWPIHSFGLAARIADDGPRVTFSVDWEAPHDEAARSMLLEDGIVTREVISHTTVILLGRDWYDGTDAHRRRWVATLHGGETRATVVRDGSLGRGIRAAIALGRAHIATGTDHLVFLWLLLLSATGRGRSPVRRILAMVTAFTVGHSITLAAQALGGVHAPARWVEPAVALTILASALSLFRDRPSHRAPRESWLAAGFGLVHGLAFASALTEQELGPRALRWTLFGFNLGVELEQLVVVALVAPWLLLIGASRWRRGFVRLGATLGVIAGAGWLIERAFHRAVATSAWLDRAAAHPLIVVLVLAAVALLARMGPPSAHADAS